MRRMLHPSLGTVLELVKAFGRFADYAEEGLFVLFATAFRASTECLLGADAQPRARGG